MKYTLGDMAFATKEDAKKHVSKILQSYVGSPGPLVNDSHKAVLNDVIKMHERFKAYNEIGIVAIETWDTGYGPGSKSIGFRAVLANGLKDPFSYVKAIQRPSPWSEINALMRKAILPQVLAWKRAQPRPVRSAISGIILTEDVFEADHSPPNTFRKILADFAGKDELLKLNLKDNPNGTGKLLEDEGVTKGWEAFHEKRVVFRALHRKENAQQRSEDIE